MRVATLIIAAAIVGYVVAQAQPSDRHVAAGETPAASRPWAGDLGAPHDADALPAAPTDVLSDGARAAPTGLAARDDRPLARTPGDASTRGRDGEDTDPLAVEPIKRSGDADPPAVESRVPSSAAQIALSFAPVVKLAAPAVVNVNTTAAVDTFYATDPFLRRLYDGQAPRGGSALGSGVVVDPSGLVVTNAHVIKDAAAIRVGFNDRREFDATLLLTDERSDLAVLKIAGKGPFPTVALGDPARLEVGDLVLAIGNPFGVGQTVTQGIVSATARTELGVSDARFFLQTDAAINPGNSGGALIDMAGRLVGINTAIYSRSGGSIGIGFAIPSDMVRLVVDAARTGKHLRRPWLGADVASVTADLAGRLGLDRATGAVVTEVAPKGPAAAAGLEVADVITTVDGIAVTDKVSFDYTFATRGLSGTVELGIRRDGKARTATVALGPPPEAPPRDARRIAGRTPFAGATAQNLSPAVADELNLTGATAGVVLSAVEDGSVAARLGFVPRDIVREVNDARVVDTASLEALGRRRLQYWDVVVERDGRLLHLSLGG